MYFFISYEYLLHPPVSVCLPPIKRIFLLSLDMRIHFTEVNISTGKNVVKRCQHLYFLNEGTCICQCLKKWFPRNH